jgi:hypothetical protein
MLSIKVSKQFFKQEFIQRKHVFEIFFLVLYPKTRIPIEIGPECDVKHENKRLDNFQLTAL